MPGRTVFSRTGSSLLLAVSIQVLVAAPAPAQVNTDSSAIAAALAYLRGDVADPAASRAIRLLLVEPVRSAAAQVAPHHDVRWTSPHLLAVFGRPRPEAAAEYAVMMQLDDHAAVCSASVHHSGRGRRPEFDRAFLDEAVLGRKGIDAVLARHAEDWTFRDLSWGFETTERDALLALATVTMPAGMSVFQEDTVLLVGTDVAIVQGHLAFTDGRRTPFLIALHFDERSRITSRVDVFELRGTTFPRLEQGGEAGAALAARRCR